MAVSIGGPVGVHGWTDMKSLTVQVMTGRWYVLFASFLIMSAAGATFMFGLYSGDIKSTLGYDQTTLNLLSFWKDFGGTVGIISGLIQELMPPWVVLFIGAVLNLFGFCMIWLAVTERIPKPSVGHMCVYTFIAANSQSFANTGSLVPCVKNFPESRGAVLGILKGYMGLSGAIITQLYHAFYFNDRKALILFIGWLPTVISLIFLPTIRYLKPVHQPNEQKVFYNFLYISLGFAGFLMAMNFIQKKFSFTQNEYGVSSVMVLFLLFLPLLVVINEEYKIWQSKRLALVDPSPVKVVTEGEKINKEEASNGTETVSFETQENKWWQKIFSPPERGEDYTILQALFSIDMIIIFLACICGVGGTGTAIDNLGQIGASLGYPKNSISTFVSLVSTSNYLGRVFSGFGSEHLLLKYKCPRPLMLTLILLLAGVGNLLIAFDVPNGLYAASIIIGFCFGALWPLIFAIISEIFGLKYYSTLYNFGTVASPIGLYVLNVKVTGSLYDKEAMKQLAASGLQRKAGQELKCIGDSCFKLSFIIMAVANLIGAIFSLILVARTRKFYKGDIYQRFRNQAKVTDANMVAVENNDGRREESKLGGKE